MSGQRAWHFCKIDKAGNPVFRDGRPLPEVGEWLVHKGDVILCRSGLHASVQAIDALRYAPGSYCCLVEMGDVLGSADDKIVSNRRKIIAEFDATETLRQFARMVALQAVETSGLQLDDVVVNWLKTGDESLRSAARDAARDAVWSAVWDAAESAAESAARDAAESAVWFAAGPAVWDAAEFAAWSTVRSAARSAAWSTQNDLLESLLLGELAQEGGYL
jgi:hypothetical protein